MIEVGVPVLRARNSVEGRIIVAVEHHARSGADRSIPIMTDVSDSDDGSSSKDAGLPVISSPPRHRPSRALPRTRGSFNVHIGGEIRSCT